MRSIAEIFSSYEVLDSEGRHVNGTDKNGPNHQYGDAYEQILTIPNVMSDPGKVVRQRYPHSIRSDTDLMMEIGVAGGASLLAWSEVFPNAHCVGLDIMPDPSPMLYGKDRIEFHIGDMRSHEDCLRAASGRMFDFICEDATHILEDSLRTLLYLWPHVRPGGVYVIEEFANIGAHRRAIIELWPFARIIDTVGPFGGCEPLVVLRKPL